MGTALSSSGQDICVLGTSFWVAGHSQSPWRLWCISNYYSNYSFASKRIWIRLLTLFIIHSFHAIEFWDLCVSGGRVISLPDSWFVFREHVSTWHVSTGHRPEIQHILVKIRGMPMLLNFNIWLGSLSTLPNGLHHKLKLQISERSDPSNMTLRFHLKQSP